MTGLGLLVLRLTLSVVFVMHGAHALFGLGAGPGVGPGGLTATAANFRLAGLEPGYLMAVLGAVIQLGGGLLIGFGWLTRFAAAAVLLYVLLTGWKVHLMWGFFLNWGTDPTRGHGLEFAVALGGGLACLLLAGGGDFSLDGIRAKQAASRAAGRARLRRS